MIGKTLDQMTAEIVAVNTQSGWFDKPVSFLEAMALLHSEVSEAVDAWRHWGTDDATGFRETRNDALPKPEGVGSEFADVFIRLLDDCYRFGVDLQAEYERKLAYNATRPYRHGEKAA